MADETTAAAPLDGPRRGAAAGDADALVVFLHGYGANGDDLFGLAEPLSQVLPNAAFASPNAPETVPGAPMLNARRWFALPWLDGSDPAEMAAGVERAQAALSAFLDAELTRAGVKPERLALVGFSQGAMMALQFGPTRTPGPAAIVGLSGRLGDPTRLAAEIKSRPPILLGHGDRDDVVPFAAMGEAERALRELGFSVATHVSRGVGHGIDEGGLIATARFLAAHLAPAPQ